MAVDAVMRVGLRHTRNSSYNPLAVIISFSEHTEELRIPKAMLGKRALPPSLTVVLSGLIYIHMVVSGVVQS